MHDAPDFPPSGSGGITIVRRDYREDIDWLRAIAVLRSRAI
jgi:hypothetical protein